MPGVVEKCGNCKAEKRTFGSNVYLCPGCDFARCSKKGCGRTVHELHWDTCPHCRTRQ